MPPLSTRNRTEVTAYTRKTVGEIVNLPTTTHRAVETWTNVNQKQGQFTLTAQQIKVLGNFSDYVEMDTGAL